MRNKKRNKNFENNDELYEYDELSQLTDYGFSDYSTIEIEIPNESIQKPKKRRKRFLFFILFFSLLLILINIGTLFFTGKLWFNNPDKLDYPIKGTKIDSDYGKVNWDILSSQNLSFVYVKATKGTAFKDEQFENNWKESKDTSLVIGAYHIFNLTKDGEKQAEYFSEAMGDSITGRLIPAVEVKIAGFNMIISPEKQKVVKNLKDFCNYIQSKYDVTPLIICNNRSYEKYLLDDFSKYPIWIDSYYSSPQKNLNWSFWGFNPRMKFRGYDNKDKYLTLTVYNENQNIEEFKKKYVC